MLRRVHGTVGSRRRRRSRLLETLAAVAAEAKVRRSFGAAVRAARGEGGAASTAEAHPGGALEAALRAAGRGEELYAGAGAGTTRASRILVVQLSPRRICP